MIKPIVNIVFFLVIVAIIFFMVSSPVVYGNNSPQQYQVQTQSQSQIERERERQRQRERVNSNTIELEYEPIYITPSNVTYVPVTNVEINNTNEESNVEIEENRKNQYINRHSSPTSSLAPSTYLDCNIEYKNAEKKEKKEKSKLSLKRESIGEKLCDKIFNEFLAQYFKNRKAIKNIRPNFLKNPKTKRNLELDLYDPIGIAIEYNGFQHSNYVEVMHGDQGELINQIYRDNLKAKLCKDLGIILIIVDYTVDNTIIDDNGNSKKVRLNETQREIKIRNYLWPKLELAIEELRNSGIAIEKIN